jgi:CheY-like chemotaxis protein
MVKCLVLLADDVEDAREAYALYLERRGFSVHQIGDGDRVVPLAIELQPDVIVLDLAMPGLDGWAATAQLRAHPLTRDIPIVVLTAHAYAEHESRALAAGASLFLRKPCSPPALADALLGVSESCQRKADPGRAAAPAIL